MDYTIKRGDMEIQLTAEEIQNIVHKAKVEEQEHVVEKYLDDNYSNYTPRFKQKLYDFYREHGADEEYIDRLPTACLSDGVSEIEKDLNGYLEFVGGIYSLLDLVHEPEFEAVGLNNEKAYGRLCDLYSDSDNLMFRERVYEYVLVKSCTSSGMELSRAEEEMNIDYQATLENLVAATEIAVRNYRSPMDEEFDLDKKAYSYTVLSFDGRNSKEEIHLPGYINKDNLLTDDAALNRLYQEVRKIDIDICPASEIGKDFSVDFRHYCVGNKDISPDLALKPPEHLLFFLESDLSLICFSDKIRFIDSSKGTFDLCRIELDAHLSQSSLAFCRYDTENGFTAYSGYNEELVNSHKWKMIQSESLDEKSDISDCLNFHKDKFVVRGNDPDLPMDVKPSIRVIQLIEKYKDSLPNGIEIVKSNNGYVQLWKNPDYILEGFRRRGLREHENHEKISPNSVKGIFLLPDTDSIHNDYETAFSAVESVEIAGKGSMSKENMAKCFTKDSSLDHMDIVNVTVNTINRYGVPQKITTGAEGFFMAVNNFQNNFRDFAEAYQTHEAKYPSNQNQSQNGGKSR